jgi:hypothetical protein
MTTRGLRRILPIALIAAGCASPAGSALINPSTPIASTPVVGAASPALPSSSTKASPTPPASASSAAPVTTIVIPKTAPAPALAVAWEAKGPTIARPSTFAPAVAPDGSIWVVSGHDASIWEFSADGHLHTTWGARGSGPGQFDFEHQNGGGDLPDGYGGVAFGPDGTVDVLDTGNARVERFRADGKYLDSWGSFGNGPGQFVNPTGIAVDPTGNVYVVDGRLDVQVFDAHGTWIRTIGAGQAGDSPYYGMVAVGRGGHVFTNNGQFVLEYDPTGMLLRRVDLSAFDAWPVGVAVEKSGNLLVLLDAGTAPADHPAGTIELGPDDRLLHVWPATGESLALDAAGDAAYVTFYQWPFIRKYTLPGHP